MSRDAGAATVAIELPASLRVVVHGHADAAWHARLAAQVGGALVLIAESGDAIDALRKAAAGPAGGDVLLLAARTELPPGWVERLLLAAGRADTADVVSPLGNLEPALSPWAPGVVADRASTEAIDAGAFLYAERSVVPTRHWLPSCSLWRERALQRLAAQPRWRGPLLPDAIAGAVCDHLYVGTPGAPLRGPRLPEDPRFPQPASPLATLRARHIALTAAPRPGLDGRPVLLHVLHGWGGGAERFVRDWARADDRHVHLALVARGLTARRTYGEAVELIVPALDAAPPLRRWPLPRPIAATADGDAAYAAILDALLASFAVDAIVVSSLIGHDLAVLRTGKPTLVVGHDHYPWWPVLHADFGDARRRFDRGELAHELAGEPEGFPFAERDADAWWALREAYLDALRQARATLVFPTRSAEANALRLEPRLDLWPRAVIGHGFRPFTASDRGAKPDVGSPTTAVAAARPLRVLVLGRIAGGKGEVLLARVIPALVGTVEFHLLGCGAAGQRFFGTSGVDVELDYARDALPAAIARIAPDCALLPVTVAETFSYTLSELWALGVPPVATRLGSLAERIDHGTSGLLVDADADAVVATLRLLGRERAILATIRDALDRIAPRDTRAMAGDYAALLALGTHAGPRYALARPAPAALALAEASEAAQRLALDARQQRDRLAAQQLELERRAEWAYRMERQFRERATWAEQLDRELGEERRARDATRAALEQLEGEFAERTEWALRMRAELEAVRAEWDAARRTVPGLVAWLAMGAFRRWSAFKRRVRTSLAYRSGRVRALAGRLRLSLRTRGLLGTLRRTREWLRRDAGPLPTPPEIPELGAAFAPFALPTSAKPRVSIVVPVHDHFRHTHACLRSLAAHAATLAFEVIVVDDASSDETPARLAEVGGIHALRLDPNRGFIGACNAGAAQARGEFLVFLNNDTAVTPGWLEALVGTFAQRPDAGLVGAKLVYPDGRLQEAGGIVFADGSGWNYGRFGDPSDPAYNVLREADYCSGAAIAIPRALFERLGGFDTRYAPAYYEDTDLAFRVRESGATVYYQPAATVVHFEGVSSGTDTGSGVKRYQVVNQAKFVERWSEALRAQPKPGTPITLAREHRRRGRVLIVDAVTPMPDHDSGSLRMVNLMRVLRELGWGVTFFADNRARVPGYSEALQQLGVEVLWHPWFDDPVAWFRERGRELDAVLLSRHYVAQGYVGLVREYAPHARLIFDTVDLHYLREQRAAALERRDDLARIAAETKRKELALVRACDVTLVVSPVEQALLKLEHPPARVEVLSNVHEAVGRRRGFAERKDLYFVGGFQHPPNVDAVLWFAREAWPRVAQALPEARFHVVGSRTPPAIEALAGERIVICGQVSDMTPYLDGCRLTVAPLRYGAGVKGKVNHAMAHGQPVVATTIAVEGMHARPGDDVLVADDPVAFGEAVVRAYTDEALWLRLSDGGLDNVRRYFGFEAARAALARILP